MLKSVLKKSLKGFMALTALAWLAGFVLYSTDNPEKRYQGTLLTAKSDEMLRRACFDCHSNETRYPWYYRLPFINLSMGHNIDEGREELNFSSWDQMSAKKRMKMLKESLEEMQEGEMPTFGYKLVHWGENPSEAEIRVFKEDLLALRMAAGLGGLGGDGDDDDDDDHDEDDDDDDD